MSSNSAQVTALAAHIECLLGQHAESLSPADVYLAVRQGCGRFLAQRNARCPAARLPHDILAIVFVSLEQDERLTASAVCQQWRAAALNDARIWSDIGIFVECDPFQYNDDLLLELDAHCCPWDYPRVSNTSNYRLLPLLLERSKAVPVTLNLFFSAHSQTGIQDRILAHLTAHAAHIKSLSITTEGCHRWHRILAFLPQKMPLLTRVSLNRPDAYDSGMAVSHFGMRARDRWSRYPSLEVLEFDGVCELLAQGPTPKPSPSIKNISLRNVDITYSLLCELFKFFPSLRTLQIEVQPLNIDTWWNSDTFVAIPHRLDCLRITGWTSSEQYSAFMSALRAEQIRKLSIRPAYPDDHIARVFSHLASIGTLSLQVGSDAINETLVAVDVDGRERQTTSRSGSEKLLHLAKPLDLRRLTELTLSCHAWEQLEDLLPTSRVLPALQTLSVIVISKKDWAAGFDDFTDLAQSDDLDLCDTHAVKLLSPPLECPALQLLSFTTWQYGAPCKVPVSILTTVVRSLAAPKLDVRVQGILLVGDRDETATTDQRLQQLKELTRSLTYGRRSI